MTDLTLINARVYSMNRGYTDLSGLTIKDGKILSIIQGDQDVRSTIEGQVLDLEGRTVLPGLTDSHLHLRKYAETLAKIDTETTTREECLARVAKAASAAKPGDWVLGHGWNHNNWADGYGSAAELDQIAPQNPVYLTGKSLHVSWANTSAMNLGGIHSETADPPGGAIQRDEKGDPTGILFEDAVKLIEGILPEPTVEETAKIIENAQESLWTLGLTGVHDFDREHCLKALQHLHKNDRLRLRIMKSIPSSFLTEAIERRYKTWGGDDWLWIGGVKEFMDGALGPQTAAMLAPYAGTEDLGMLLKSEDQITEIGIKAAAGGLGLAVHAIGDLANHTLINAIQRVRDYEKEKGILPLPQRIEHVQLIDPADLPRMHALGIIASMQPIHATSDMEMADLYWGSRTAYAYAPKHQFDLGTQVIFGSDAPVENPNPWKGIHAAVTRRRPDGSPGEEGWHPEGRISRQQAIEGFTTNPAKAAGRENRIGRLIPGSWADLIILDIDPFTCPADQLDKLEPLGTMIAGKWVHRTF